MALSPRRHIYLTNLFDRFLDLTVRCSQRRQGLVRERARNPF